MMDDQTIKARLPDYQPATQVVEAPWAGSGRFSRAEIFHPIVKVPDGQIAVDVWVDGEKTMARIWKRADHPNLEKLPWNAPRRVKALYRADGQLAHMRSSDYWTDPAKLAMDAWDHFQENNYNNK